MPRKTVVHFHYAVIFLAVFSAIGLSLAYFQNMRAPKIANTYSTDDRTPLRVTIIKSQEKAQIVEGFSRTKFKQQKYDIILTNVSQNTVNIGMWNCSFTDNWKTSDSSISFFRDFLSCNSNFIESTIINPQKYTKLSYHLYQILKKPTNKSKFHLIFHPSMPFCPVPQDSYSSYGKSEFEIHQELKNRMNEYIKRQKIADQEQASRWTHDPLNQDFTSNEIEF